MFWASEGGNIQPTLTMAKKKTEQLLREQKSMKMLTNLHKIYSEW